MVDYGFVLFILYVELCMLVLCLLVVCNCGLEIPLLWHTGFELCT